MVILRSLSIGGARLSVAYGPLGLYLNFGIVHGLGYYFVLCLKYPAIPACPPNCSAIGGLLTLTTPIILIKNNLSSPHDKLPNLCSFLMFLPSVKKPSNFSAHSRPSGDVLRSFDLFGPANGRTPCRKDLINRRETLGFLPKNK